MLVDPPLISAPPVGTARNLARLVKARLGLLVLFATAAGFCLSADAPSEAGWRLTLTLLGTGMVCGGAAALNQAMEVRWDRLMARTRRRPLPSGAWTRAGALRLGAGLSAGGLAVLALGTTLLSTTLAALALGLYLAVYTPLKRRTPGCVLAGAVAGALPPVIGEAAAQGRVTWLGAWLFALVFAWQMPHLAAIAWMHREDYATAGFALPRHADPHGRKLSAAALAFSVLLSGISLASPAVMNGGAAPALLFPIFPNAFLLTCSVAFLATRSRESARWLFFASIFYLPAILGICLLARR